MLLERGTKLHNKREARKYRKRETTESERRCLYKRISYQRLRGGILNIQHTRNQQCVNKFVGKYIINFSLRWWNEWCDKHHQGHWQHIIILIKVRRKEEVMDPKKSKSSAHSRTQQHVHKSNWSKFRCRPKEQLNGRWRWAKEQYYIQ